MISVVVLTKNEEKNIEKCLKSLLWCGEIIIIDDYSDDKTIKIAKRFKVKIFKRKLNNDFASQRNFALRQVQGKDCWILFIDADEVVSINLQKEIIEKTNNKKFNAFYLKRKDFFFGKELRYGETGNIKILRLARRNSGIWSRKVHEFWDVKNEVGELVNPILHYSHKTLMEFIDDINMYSTIHAEENKREGKNSTILKIILLPAGKFIDNYFLKLGFLDGIEGFIMAIMMSFHSFLAWSKLWIN